MVLIVLRNRFYFLLVILTWMAFKQELKAQKDTIVINNPSFEGKPTGGQIHNGYIYTKVPDGWYDCGRMDFPTETPPDIHPSPMEGFFGVTQKPLDGNTYLGMVVRYNESWESVSQRLSYPLLGNKCYKFSIALMKSPIYLSEIRGGKGMKNFTKPIVLRIWGANGYCGRKELLAESDPVNNINWLSYEFEFRPRGEYRFIVLEAFYVTPTIDLYGGHILIDNASLITEFSCDGEEEVEEIIAAVEPIKKPTDSRPTKPKKPKESIPDKVVAPKKQEVPVVKKNKLTAGLDRSKLKKGQTLKIENIYFKANAEKLEQSSYPAMDELYEFLKENRDIVVEIGGHTNGIPPHDFCDKLSTDRARTVAEYLIANGISPKRLSYKGYGKRKRISTDRTAIGRRKNQRVEIKIISIG